MMTETLITAKGKKDISFLEEMNLQTDAVVINQGETDNKKLCKTSSGKKILFIDTVIRGLSRSRNAAIINATSDICSLCDDGFIHSDNFARIIEEAYSSYPDADVITFQALTPKGRRTRRYHSQPYKHNLITVMSVTADEITFRPEAINRVCLRFDTDFGEGGTFFAGDDTLFLSECIKRDLRVYYIPVVIGTITKASYKKNLCWSIEFFVGKGAAFRAAFDFLAAPFCLIYAIIKHSDYKRKCSFFKALHCLRIGRRDYKRLEKKKRKTANGNT